MIASDSLSLLPDWSCPGCRLTRDAVSEAEGNQEGVMVSVVSAPLIATSMAAYANQARVLSHRNCNG